MVDLNQHQKAAVHYVNGPLLVLAGAGSGKTSVITQKIAALIKEYGVPASHIVAVTFTNKAAREMKSRVTDLLAGNAIRELAISTFHSFGLRILREQLKLAGYRPGVSIYDTEDSRTLLVKLLRSMDGDPRTVADPVQWQISRWKNDLIGPTDAQPENGNRVQQLAARVYVEYERHMQAYNALDFDDLIVKPVMLLNGNSAVLNEYRGQVRYLMVDEYQDTNRCQYELARLLVGDNTPFTMVGDDDQSIYGWRGARPENLERLKQDFPQCRVIKLEQNYRSCGRILKAANAVIANNPHVFDKALWSKRDYGDPLRVLKGRNEEHEAERVVAELLYHKFKHSTDYRDYAILFRENMQARVFERVLRERRIPYYLSGGNSFFDKTEVKDIMAYLRLLSNPDDDSAFLRVVNTPRREVGAATLETLANHAASIGKGLLASSFDDGLASRLTSRQLTNLRAFTDWASKMVEEAQSAEPAALTSDLVKTLRYDEWLRDTCNDARMAERRMENVKDLTDWIARLARQDNSATLSDLVAKLILSGMLDKDSEDNGDQVSLMTLHAAKGLEFPHVFMVGMEEGLLPHHQSVATDNVEEERRLAYVGITRAQRSLAFSYAMSRRRGGEVIDGVPSRFLQEIPTQELEWENATNAGEPAKLQRAETALAELRAMLDETAT
ncbi:MAG TPA: UvrD-helicase domain-containing protein [Burkholderiales bacterium]|nr:UvrD-helicase domain-containing protein [Burkholderiales bacterium]